MSQTAKTTKTLRMGSKTFQEVVEVEGDTGVLCEPSGGVPAAKVGQLTTRTDNDTGVITGLTGHGIISTNVIDIYWVDTGVPKARYGMVATVAALAISVDGGTGDNLPTNLTAVTFMKPHVESFTVDGDNVVGLGFYSSRWGRITLSDAGGIEASEVLAAGGSAVWASGGGETNPIAADDIITIEFSHSYSAGAAAMSVGVLYA